MDYFDEILKDKHAERNADGRNRLAEIARQANIQVGTERTAVIVEKNTPEEKPSHYTGAIEECPEDTHKRLHFVKIQT